MEISVVQLAKDSWVNLSDLINNLDAFRSSLLLGRDNEHTIVVVDTSNWMIHTKVVSSDVYVYPKKGKVPNYQDLKTEWLELDEVLDRVSDWKDRGFSHQLDMSMNPFFLNGLFRYIRLHRMETPNGIKWLWCGVDDKSYPEGLLNDLILFNNELEALIELGKENTEKELKKLDDNGIIQ